MYYMLAYYIGNYLLICVSNIPQLTIISPSQ